VADGGGAHHQRTQQVQSGSLRVVLHVGGVQAGGFAWVLFFFFDPAKKMKEICLGVIYDFNTIIILVIYLPFLSIVLSLTIVLNISLKLLL
jgi:hypothetical protein